MEQGSVASQSFIEIAHKKQRDLWRNLGGIGPWISLYVYFFQWFTPDEISCAENCKTNVPPLILTVLQRFEKYPPSSTPISLQETRT